MHFFRRNCLLTSLTVTLACLGAFGQERVYDQSVRQPGGRSVEPDPRAASAIQPGGTYGWAFPASTAATLFTGDYAFSFTVGPNVTSFRIDVVPLSPSTADMDIFVRRGMDPTVGTSGVVADYQNASDSSGPVALTVNASSGNFLTQGDYRIALAVWLPLNQAVNGTIRLTLTEGSGCTYTLTSPLGTGSRIQLGSAAATGTLNVNTASGCTWSGTSNVTWLRLTVVSGTGPGTIQYNVDANTGAEREAIVSLAQTSITLVQAAGSTTGLRPGAKIIPHIAAGAEWTTTIYLTNLSVTASETFSLDYYQPDGTKWALSMNNGASATSLGGILSAGQTLVLTTTKASVLKSGWAAVYGGTNVTGFAVFRATGAGGGVQEAAVPILSQTPKQYVMQYSANSESDSGIALVNPTTAPLRVTISFRTLSGQNFGSHFIDLPALGHTAVSAIATFPAQAVAASEGVMTLTAPSGFGILGLRFNVRSASFTSFEPFYVFGTVR